MQNNFHHVFWDWHGVLGRKGFWHQSSKTDKELQKLVAYIFSDKARINDWMRGSLTIEDLIKSTNSSLTKEKLAEYLLKDWEETRAINIQLFSAVHGLYENAEHMIVTDNMDVFGDYAETNPFLKKNFSRIFNSSDHKILKDDTPGLFEFVKSELNLSSFDGCLLLDDSETNCQRFESLGGTAILVKAAGL